MKRTLFFTLCFCVCAINVYAGEYAGLTPGVSTKKEADKEFGAVVRSMENGRRLDYSTEGHDLKRLSVVLKEKGMLIQSIDLFLEETYTKPQVVKWFDLEGESQKEYDISGKLIEYYKKDGIKIYFEGPEERSGVFILSHVDIPEKKSASKQIESCPEAAIKYYEEAEPYFDDDQHKQAAELLNKASLCNPNKALYSTMLAYSYSELGEHRKAIKAAKHSVDLEDDHEAYSLLGLLYWEDKDCRSAIPYLEKAIATGNNKEKSENLELLGACFYQESRLNEALTVLVKSYKRNKKSPLTVYFLAAVSDRLDNKNDAKHYYKKYLRLKHDDKDMNFMAKERLSVLNRSTRKKSTKSWGDAFGTVLKDLKDYNAE